MRATRFAHSADRRGALISCCSADYSGVGAITLSLSGVFLARLAVGRTTSLRGDSALLSRCPCLAARMWPSARRRARGVRHPRTATAVTVRHGLGCRRGGQGRHAAEYARRSLDMNGDFVRGRAFNLALLCWVSSARSRVRADGIRRCADGCGACRSARVIACHSARLTMNRDLRPARLLLVLPRSHAALGR
jgi:hypothetical protein